MRILVVDDDYISGVMLKSALATYGDCDLAPTGSIAIDLIAAATKQRVGYELIMLDLNLPDMNGQEILSGIRAEERTAEAHTGKTNRSKIVVVTSSSDANTVSRVNALGADTFIAKPFNAQKIKDSLATLSITAQQESSPSKVEKRILIVDDSYMSGLMLKDILREHGDCDLAPNGKIALELYSASRAQGIPYSLITLDLNLPDMSGKRILHSIRSVEKVDKTRHVGTSAYILIVTASKEKSDILEAAKEGVNGYILKPFSDASVKVELGKAGFLEQ